MTRKRPTSAILADAVAVVLIAWMVVWLTWKFLEGAAR